MNAFVVETYRARDAAGSMSAVAQRLRQAAEELTRDGSRVRYLRSLFVPQDETCLLVFEADSADLVREAAARAGVAFERVAQAVPGEGGEQEAP